jgi:transcriptional regulator with XRE-family HTH domain
LHRANKYIKKEYITVFNKELLKNLRLKNNLTMRKVADCTDLAESTICCYETGRRRPSVEVAKKFGRLFDIDWTKFFE